ncbi:MAG: fructose-bisphosphate aldolase class I [Candidatus Buchananbacteria bacterium]|nr:fructose-bisphosphate aldolase class I [Candidatus Buchananbacteria bacterium]
MIDQVKINGLNQIAKTLLTPGKGILAADESFGTIGKRFDKIGLASTEENRRAYREMLLTAPELNKYISGVIMFDETIRQSTADGVLFVEVLTKAGILPGIKVDQSTTEMPESPTEKLTKGLIGLPERLKEYAALGAKFAKWRAVITISDTTPTENNLRQNALDLAQYAKDCQDAGLVPIVEPEVLMDGSHTMERCAEVSKQILTMLFEELNNLEVAIEGVLLKTNMVVPGKNSGQKASSNQIAEATIKLFKDVLPANLPGQVFLSGGQTEVEATVNLNAINSHGPFPWPLSFSYGRALQDSALATWNGEAKNVVAAQTKLIHRAKMNSLAALGQYNQELER